MIIICRDGRKFKNYRQRLAFRSIPFYKTVKEIYLAAKVTYADFENKLKAVLEPNRLHLNASKQKVQPLFSGKQSVVARKHLLRVGLRYSEYNTVVDTARYLGPDLNIDGTNTAVVQAKKDEVNIAPFRFARLFSADIPKFTRISMLNSHILSKLYTGCGAFCWTKIESEAFEKLISKSLRRCMRGRAFSKTVLKDCLLAID